jgi:hypothetical protein
VVALTAWLAPALRSLDLSKAQVADPAATGDTAPNA